MKRDTLKIITQLQTDKVAFARIVDLESKEERIVRANADPSADEFETAALTACRADKSGIHEIAGRDHFVNVFNPPLRLIIVGAVHIAQPLSMMAAQAGYAIIIIDPREAFASQERFPNIVLSHDWPDEAVATFEPDARTAIVTLTHDPKMDDPALHAALKSDCFYIGSLGSKKTHGARLERLRRAGFDDADLARIHGPVGLFIGGKSPSEIAISILAEITQVLRQGAAS